VTRIVLASTSAARQAMLEAARVPFDSIAPAVDEPAIRMLERARGVTPFALAGVLANAKAVEVSARRDMHSRTLVVGADQTLELDDRAIDKAGSSGELWETLAALSGRTHMLHAAVVVARDGASVWTHTETARLTMRALSPGFLEDYLSRHGESVRSSLGGYWYEAEGVQLFERVDGDYFTILGLPLIPLLNFLRQEGALPT